MEASFSQDHNYFHFFFGKEYLSSANVKSRLLPAVLVFIA